MRAERLSVPADTRLRVTLLRIFFTPFPKMVFRFDNLRSFSYDNVTSCRYDAQYIDTFDNINKQDREQGR